MPVAIKTIKSTKKATLGEPVDIRDYWFDKTMEPLAVAYGCFSPFTGKYGHGRLLEAAKKRGIKKFVILSPNKKQPLDDDRNMFTLEQKVEIAATGAEELGYDIQDAFIAQGNFIISALFEVAERFPENRIVLICGPDRADEYGKLLNQYDKRREQLPDSKSNAPGKFEMISVADRGSKNVSGTKVRETIRNNDKESFMEMTGYPTSMWNLVRRMAIKNGVISEAMTSTARVGIKHLYNPGNPQQLGPLEFIDVLDWLKEQNGKLTNGKNYSMTEKSDGTAFRMGLDDEEQFFIEQSYSGPVYDPQFFKDKYEQKFGKLNRLGRGWMNLLSDLQKDKKTQQCLEKIFNEVGPFKVLGEAFINELGLKSGKGLIQFVGSKYEEKKIGKKYTIIMFDIVDIDGNSISGAQKYIKDLIKNASTADIKYDDAEIDYNANMNLSSVVNKIVNNINKINQEYLENYDKDVETILNDKSRMKADIALKKEVKALIEEQQGILNTAIEKQLEKYKGKWGPDYEGVVLKLSDGTMLKITSKSFKEFKASHDTAIQDFVMGESFYFDAMEYLRG